MTTEARAYRVGFIVPSSNTTIEREIPELLRRREAVLPERFSFHSSRVRMTQVTQDELTAMVRDSDRCAVELADARVDAVVYACLVATMCQGEGFHREIETQLGRASGEQFPVVSSAGALVRAIQDLGAERVAIVTPYMKALTETVVAYLATEGIEVTDSISLEVADNLAVGRLDPERLLDHLDRLDTGGADAVVLSCCVQMPSLPVLERAEQRVGVPVLSAATASTRELLLQLGLEPVAPGAGRMLGTGATEGATR
jgi:maleate isomerase